MGNKIIICLTVILALSALFSERIYAAGCTSVSLPDKILLNIDDLKNSLTLLLLMDPAKRISYSLQTSDRLYRLAAKQSNPNLAYVLSLRAENYVTESGKYFKALPTTEHLDIQSMVNFLTKHLVLMDNMKSDCDWNAIKGYIRSNIHSLRGLYFYYLPFDTGMRLLKENR